MDGAISRAGANQSTLNINNKTAASRGDVQIILNEIKNSNLHKTSTNHTNHSRSNNMWLSCLISIDKSGFYLNVVPYSHLMDPEFSEFHRYQVLRVWVPPNCFIIFHRQLLHGGCKSEYDSKQILIPDNRVFCYIVPSKIDEMEEDFPDHREVYPPEYAHLCAYLNGSQGHCNTCHIKGFDRDNYYTIDPCVLYDRGYDTVIKDFPMGHVIFGDMETMGFAIVRGQKITHPLKQKIYSLRDHFKTVHSGLTEQTGRCMVIPPSELSNALVSQEEKWKGKNLFCNLLNSTIGNIGKAINIDADNLQYYKPNIIFNRSDIAIDQKVHYDYIYEVSEKPSAEKKVKRKKSGIVYSGKGTSNKESEFASSEVNTLAKDIEINKKKKRKSSRKDGSSTQYYLTSAVTIEKKINT